MDYADRVHGGAAIAFPAPHASAIEYRSDIDGLRAVAVLLVIAYHLGIPPIIGGFIGVDVFYVISGFLITSILQRDAVLRPAALADFYNRRIKRLLPAFLFVLLVTSAVSAFLLLPDDLFNYVRSARESLLFRSNQFFQRQAADYFAPTASELPWLHTWSLSIEWQYYLTFPAIFLVVRRIVGEHGLLPAMALLTGCLAVISILASRFPDAAYYSAIARAFEFFAGSLAAIAKPPTLRRHGANALVALALAALLGISMLYSRETRYPGVNALLVCTLALVPIVYGADNPLLTNRWAVYLGRRSYSAYLWHWPVVAFMSYLQLGHSTFASALLLIPIFLLSEFSYAYVERPGRRLRMPLRWSILLFIVLPLVLVVATLRVLRGFDGFPARFGADAERIYKVLKEHAKDADGCNNLDAHADIEPCALGDLAAPGRALLIGDSHARHYWSFVDVLAQQAHVKVYGLTNGECLALEGVSQDKFGLPYPMCQEATKTHYDMIKRGGFKYVFIAQRWLGYQNSQLELLEPAVATIIASGAVPVILKPIAEDGENRSKCFFRHLKLRQPYLGGCNMAVDNTFMRDKKAHIDDLIERVRLRHPSLIVIDAKLVQCGERDCETVIDGTPIYSDLHHLNDFGSEMLARRYVQRFGNPLLAPAR